MAVMVHRENIMQYAELAEYQAVKAAVEIYCVHGATADVDAVKKAFHEKAVMNGNGNGGGQYVFGPIQNLYDLYKEVGPTEGCDYQIDVLDIAGNIAVARCVIRNWHGMDFVDYHELIKENGEWKIIAKIYQQI